MTDSILYSVKKILGIHEDDPAFDPDILMHINGVFSTLQQMGIGPDTGFEIVDETATWGTYLNGNLALNSVKTYVYLRVRLLFDPPTTSYLIDAMNNQIKELEWRINTTREDVSWVDPDPPEIIDYETILFDGGIT